MQERSAFRLAMLANGFQPLLNDCKRPIEKGWPKRIVNEVEVLSWDRSALASTGLRIDGDLAVIDVDVSEVDLVETLAATFDERFPELFAHGLVPTPAGPRRRGSRASTSRFGGSPRGAGIAATIPMIPRCRSIWSNASVRSGHGNSRSMGRMPAGRGAR
jgi:hypothetical protein